MQHSARHGKLVRLAILVGILFCFGMSTIQYSTDFRFFSQPHAQKMLSGKDVWLDHSSQTPSQSFSSDSDEKYLTDVVSKTNGFYARDYSLSLGWNNVRYIIETAVLHGRILNRTTIIPSFVYARSCEFDIATCAAYATMVNRNDATGVDEWRGLPIERQMAWRIPIRLMFNLTHLQQSHAVITTADYFRLHNRSAGLETSSGQWDVDTYHVRDVSGDMSPSLYVIENASYDPDGVIRVDRIPQDMRRRGGWKERFAKDYSPVHAGMWSQPEPHSEIYRKLTENITSLSRPIIDWGAVTEIMKDNRVTPTPSVEETADVLRENGIEVVYTYDSTIDFEPRKDVVSPVYQAVPRHKIRGLYEDFYNVSARVLLLRGEIHLFRKPGGLHFTTAESRTRYTQTVLYDFRLTDDVLALAERISDRMFALNGGRLWMASHMRRGDFVRLNWLMEADFAAHVTRVKDRLQKGREKLVSMHGGEATVYNVPDVHPDLSIVTLEPPNKDDRYYIATDERDPENLKHLREQGGVLISDLLTIEDHREFGWPILITDVLALVEQAVMSRAGYFYAHVLSSLAGGVMNLRAGLGKDPRTAFSD